MKVLMFPLASHPGAREQCIAAICDGKSFGDLHGGYTSDNQCAEGVALVDGAVDFLRSKGIGSTPTYIFADGLYQPGMLQEEPLRQRLGLGPAPAEPAPEQAPEKQASPQR